MGSGQDRGGSGAEDDGGVSVWEIVDSVCIEAVSIDAIGFENVGVESVGLGAVGVEAVGVEAGGVEALSAADKEVRVGAVVVRAFSVDGAVGMALSIAAIFLCITGLHLGKPSLHVFWNNSLGSV